jgi:uroporphyrin-III C-methyltransferase
MGVSHLISIVGVGPGDPELLTVKALKRIQEADVILYDALIVKPLLDVVPPCTIKKYFGKLCNDGQNPQKRQTDIQYQFLYWAEWNKKIVRLKSGDAMIYSRGTEEIRFCRERNLNFEVIPGITAGISGAALFHIPLTERGKNNMLLFYTGRKNETGFPEMDSMVKIIASGSPVIVYMGLNHLVELAEKLMESGVDRSIPVQILSKISQNGQKGFATTLALAKDFIENNNPETPSTILIGKNIENI